MQLLPSMGHSVAGYTPSKSGQWWTFGVSPSSTGIYPENQFFGSHIEITKSVTFQSIGAEVAVVGTAGAIVRLGIFRALDNCVDLTLFRDFGTIDGTVLGFQPIASAYTLLPGLYVVGAVTQGGAATRPTMRYGLNYVESAYVANSTPYTGGISISGVTFSAPGALPSSATAVAATSAMLVQGQVA